MLTIAECATLWQEATRLTNDSERKRWEVAPTALSVLGSGDTQRLAKAMEVDVDTVHNLAAAELLYQLIYQWDPQKAILARAIHSYVRFAEIYRKHKAYELGPAECLEYLNNGLSIVATEAQIEEHHNPVPEWRRRFDNRPARKWLDKIATEPDPDQSPKITRAAKLLKGRIEAEK